MTLPLVALAMLVAQLPPGATPDRQAPPDRPASITVVAQEAGSGAPLEGVTVILSPDPKRVFKATTFPNGAVQFSDLRPGSYTVGASSSELLALAGGSTLLVSGGETRKIVLKAGESPILLFKFKKPGMISGQVLTPEGQAVREASVEVVTTNSQVRGRPIASAGLRTSTDADGHFKLDNLPPGRYFLRARLPAPADAPLNFVYAPGTTNITEATAVVLEAGDEVALGITARSVPAVIVAGRIVNAQGEPVKDVAVRLDGLSESVVGADVFRPEIAELPLPVYAPASVRTNSDGRYVIRSVRQGLYALQAVVRGPEGDAPVLAAGVAEVDVRTSGVDELVVKLAPCARITGRFLFNGLEAPDPARSEIHMHPVGEDAPLRWGLTTSTNWHADGTFEVEGILGAHRSRYVRSAIVSSEAHRFSLKGLPPGHTYLVAVYRLPDRRYDPARSKTPVELLDELAPSAVRIFVGEPGKFELTLPPASRDR